jgi:hypothetical protein
LNVANGPTRGAQIAGAVNVTHGPLEGLEIAGAVNVRTGDLRGVQLAGAVNVTPGTVSGLQLAGALNLAGEVRGLQLAAVNIAGGDAVAQLGVVNVGRRVRGLQLGVVNVAEDSTGASIGVLNFVAHQPVNLDLSAGTLPMIAVALRHGSAVIQNIYSAGLVPFGTDLRWALGLGLGGRISRGSARIEIDAMVHQINTGAEWTRGVHLLSQLRFTVGHQFASHLALLGGLDVNCMVSTNDADADLVIGPQIAAGSRSTAVHIWPSLRVGLRI